MKKNYIAPQIETTFYEPVLMQTATKATGTIQDGEGGNQGNVDWGGNTGDPGEGGIPNPDAKGHNLWDGWDD